MRHLRFIVAIFLMLFVVVLLVENHEAMSTRVVFRVDLLTLRFESAEMTLYHIVTVAFLFGVIISGLYGIIERFRLKKEIKALVNVSRERDKELNSLRNLPITTDEVAPAPTSTTHAEDEKGDI